MNDSHLISIILRKHYGYFNILIVLRIFVAFKCVNRSDSFLINIMNNEIYIHRIIDRLSSFAYSVIIYNSISLYDKNIFAEPFFKEFLNKLLGLNLVNLNVLEKNYAGVDLYDDSNNIIVQVTATATKDKIQHSLNTLDEKQFKGCRFIFLSIARDSEHLKDKQYIIPNGISFNPKNDILDISTINKKLMDVPIRILEDLDSLTSKYFDKDIPERRTAGLSRIINLLSASTLKNDSNNSNKQDFEISDKIKKNNLCDLQENILELYKGNDVSKIYENYDKEGINKSRAVLHSINRVYLKLKDNFYGKDLFYAISEELYKSLQGDEELNKFNQEDIRYYIEIILADAFMRCKIFENPKTF